MLSEQPAWLAKVLVCPRDLTALTENGVHLVCAHGHDYPVVSGVPVMLLEEVPATLWTGEYTLRRIREGEPVEGPDPIGKGVEPVVQANVAATNGLLYRGSLNRLERYPIPRLRLPEGEGRMLVDIGCNWGRWTLSAAQRGYRAIGIDPNLEAVLAARRVAHQLGLEAAFVVADARHLPFGTGSMDTVFSYSVIQHFSKWDATEALREVGRVLRLGGTSLIQMPNWLGVRSLYHLARRGFGEGTAFNVRYWSVPELLAAFRVAVGPSEAEVDGFFGLGIQPEDMDVLAPRYRSVVRMSEVLRRVSERCRWLVRCADSVYIRSCREGSRGPQQ